MRPALLCPLSHSSIWSASTAPGLCEQKFGFDPGPRDRLLPPAAKGTRVEQASYQGCTSMDQAAAEQMIPGQGSRTAGAMGSQPGERHILGPGP